MELNKEEMFQVVGGGITSAMLNAISKFLQTVYDLGRYTGSSFRRIITGSYCSTN